MPNKETIPKFKFQYDNTLSTESYRRTPKQYKFKFQYDNTLSFNNIFF